MRTAALTSSIDVRLVLCDRHRLFAESFAQVLETLGHDVRLVNSPEETIDAVLAQPATDACLLEVEYGDHRGLAAVQTLRGEHPGIRVVLLYGRDDPRLLDWMIAAGVTGVISKAHGLDKVIVTLARLMNAEPNDRAHARLMCVPARSVTRRRERSISELTPRERETLRLLALGHSTGALALAMDVSYATARTHIQNVLAKLEVHSRLEAVAMLHHQDGGPGFRETRFERRAIAVPDAPEEERLIL